MVRGNTGNKIGRDFYHLAITPNLIAKPLAAFKPSFYNTRSVTLTDMGTDKEDSAFDPDQDKPARRSQPSANVRKKSQNPVSKVIDALPPFADKHSVLFGLILIGVIVFLVYLIFRGEL